MLEFINCVFSFFFLLYLLLNISFLPQSYFLELSLLLLLAGSSVYTESVFIVRYPLLSFKVFFFPSLYNLGFSQVDFLHVFVLFTFFSLEAFLR